MVLTEKCLGGDPREAVTVLRALDLPDRNPFFPCRLLGVPCKGGMGELLCMLV